MLVRTREKGHGLMSPKHGKHVIVAWQAWLGVVYIADIDADGGWNIERVRDHHDAWSSSLYDEIKIIHSGTL